MSAFVNALKSLMNFKENLYSVDMNKLIERIGIPIWIEIFILI